MSRCSETLARLAEGGKRPEHKRIVDSVGGNRKPFLPNQARRPPRHHGITHYEDVPDRDGVLAHAALTVNPQTSKNHDLSIVDLPEFEQTAAIVHRGSMDNVLRIIRTLARSIDAIGHR